MRLLRRCCVVTGLLLCSCGWMDTRNVGRGTYDWFTVQITGIVPADPAGLFGGEQATFYAAVQGGMAPYTYVWDFGGAVEPDTAESPSGPSTSITRTLVRRSFMNSYTVRVTATDANGVTASASETIDVGIGHPPRSFLDSAYYNASARTLTVVVSSADDGAILTVTVTPSAGLLVDQTTKVASATGPLTAVFNVSAADIIAGATGTIGVSASSGYGADATLANPVPVSIPGIHAPADTLVAIPTDERAATGEAVRVVVLTGVPANPFQYMVGVGLAVESDATYVAHSFDIGHPDDIPDVGAAHPIDGIWAAMNPAGGFLLALDSFILSSDIGGGRERWDFNITPLGGSNLGGQGGVLFNAAFSFSAPGVKTFGFEQFNGVKRSYYADADSAEYFWGDISNDGSIGPNSVTIE